MFANGPSKLKTLQADPHGPRSKAMRRLLTLWLNLREQAKELMVVSGAPNEGKSSTAVSLAAVAAGEGLKVLVVDFDRHRRGATRNLAANLKQVMPQAVMSIEVRPEIQRDLRLDALALDIFLAESLPRRRVRFRRSRRSLREYDMIVLDTPPALRWTIPRLRELAEHI